MTVSDDAIYERLSELAGRLVEEPQHTSVLARILEGPEATFTDVSALAPPSSLVAMELLRIRRDHGVCLVASHMRCPDGRPRGDTEAPTGVSMVVFYVPELAAIAETALLDRQRIFELVRS